MGSGVSTGIEIKLQPKDEPDIDLSAKIAQNILEERRDSLPEEHKMYENLLSKTPKEIVEELDERNKDERIKVTELLIREFQRLSTLNALNKEMQKCNTSLKDRLAAVIRTCCTVLDADRALIFMVDWKTDDVWLRVAKQRGCNITKMTIQNKVVFKVGSGIAGTVAGSGEVFNTGKAYEEELFSDIIDRLTGYKTESLLAIPIFEPGYDPGRKGADNNSEFDELVSPHSGKEEKTIKKEKIMGVIQVINRRNAPQFNFDDVQLLQSIAKHVSSYLHEAQLVELEYEQRKTNQAMLEIACALTSSLDTNALLKTIMAKIRKLMSADRCTLFMVDEKNQVMWSVVAQGAEEWSKFTGGDSIIQIPIGSGIAGHVAETGKTLNIQDAYENDLFNQDVDKKTGYRTKSILCGALRNQSGDIIGVVQLINKRVKGWTQHRTRRKSAHGIPGSVGAKRLSQVDVLKKQARSGSIYYTDSVDDNEIGPFPQSDERLLAGLFSMIGVAMENSTLYSRTAQVQNHLKGVLSNISELVITFDLDGKLVSINRKNGAGLFGAELSYMKSTSLENWVKDEILQKDLLQALKSKTRQNETIRRVEYNLNGRIVNYTVSKLMGLAVRRDSIGEVMVVARESLDAQRSGRYKQEQVGIILTIDDKTHEEKLRHTLNQYMAPEVVEHLLQEGQGSFKLQLGGIKQKVTILFADIRGYTSYAETVMAKEVFSTLNEYFDLMVNCVTKHGGIVDKFIGDAFMSVFGVPSVGKDDAICACRAALEMKSVLEGYNQKRKKQGRTPIDIGIGIATGEVFCGNIGAENRFEYTVIGDAVNVAARLESMTKEYGTMILLGDSTESETGVRDQMCIREIDRIRVAGKDSSTGIFELTETIESGENKESKYSLFHSGMKHYRNKNFEKAMLDFDKAVQTSGDGPSQVFLERCQYLLKTPPPESWDGIFEQTKINVWTYRNSISQPPAVSFGESKASSSNKIKELSPNVTKRRRSIIMEPGAANY